MIKLFRRNEFIETVHGLEAYDEAVCNGLIYNGRYIRNGRFIPDISLPCGGKGNEIIFTYAGLQNIINLWPGLVFERFNNFTLVDIPFNASSTIEQVHQYCHSLEMEEPEGLLLNGHSMENYVDLFRIVVKSSGLTPDRHREAEYYKASDPIFTAFGDHFIMMEKGFSKKVRNLYPYVISRIIDFDELNS
jgi:hypothetical protein